jgi:hypothetical protein
MTGSLISFYKKYYFVSQPGPNSASVVKGSMYELAA